jgi:putative membrane protein
MNGSGKRREPVAFRLDDPRVHVAEQPLGLDMPNDLPPLDMETGAALPVVVPAPARRWRWGLLFWPAAAGLVLLALGLSIVTLIEQLAARSQSLGALGLALAAVAATALVAVIAREAAGFMRLVAVDSIRARAEDVIASDDRVAGRAAVEDLLKLTRRIPSLARARTRIEEHRADIIDGRDFVHLAERELMAPLDIEARRLIGRAARRVSVVTALSPRAAVDMLFVLINALGLIRRLATLYGARPGFLGLLRLIRHVVTHLTVTGGIAVSDSLIQQVIGHGIAAKLSARLGEGVLNGLLTARLGLAAMDVTRPLPFSALPEPRLNDIAGQLLRSSDQAKTAGNRASSGK